MPSSTFRRLLTHWLSRIDTAGEGGDLARLAADGEQLIREVLAGEEHANLDPLQLRSLNGIISRAKEAGRSRAYSSVGQLQADVQRLAGLSGIPESRRGIFERVAKRVRHSRRGTGGSVFVNGQSGIGKTYLLRAVRELESNGEDLWAYHKSPQSGSAPFGAVGAILVQLCRCCSNRNGVGSQEMLREVLSLPGAHQSARELLQWILPKEIAAGLGQHNRQDQRVDISGALAALIKQIADFFLRTGKAWTGEGGAVVCAVDDLQWVDDQSCLVLEKLASEPGPVALILLGRPEAVRQIGWISEVDTITVSPLSTAESTALAEALSMGDLQEEDYQSLEAATVSARGNPLAISNTVRVARQLHRLSRLPRGFGSSSRSLASRLESVEPRLVSFLETVALMLPPVPVRAAEQLLPPDGGSLREYLAAAVSAEILVHDETDGTVAFYHDSIEEEARRRASESPEQIALASNTLLRQVDQGDDRALLVLAGNLLEGDSYSGDESQHRVAEGFRKLLSPVRSVQILRAAAERSLRLTVPKDALRFAEAALNAGRKELDDLHRLELHQIAHEAAFLADDGRSMSRHIQVIRGRGSSDDFLQARILWISRAYSKMWIRGALRIAWSILFDLGRVQERNFEDSEAREAQISHALWFFRLTTPRLMAERILSKRPSQHPEDEIAASTCGLLYAAILTIDPLRTIVLAQVILESALRRGPTPSTGFGFLYWSIYRAQTDRRVRRRQRIGELGIRIARGSSSEYVTSLFGAITATHWTRDFHETTSQLRRYYQQGIRLGSFDWAAAAASIYTQNRFYRGDELPLLFEEMDFYRRQVAHLGITRYERTIGKFQQAVECLMGRAPDPLELTGSIMTEHTALQELVEKEDRLALYGFHHLKGMLALYGGLPRRALSCFETAEILNADHAPLQATTAVWLYVGLAASRVAGREELLLALKRVRGFGTAAVGPHRIRVLEAERARRRGLRRRADRLYRRALSDALTSGFFNEAALIAEYHAEALLEWGRKSAAVAVFLQAEGLYRRWGAAPAAARISARMDSILPSRAISSEASVLHSSEANGASRKDDVLKLRALTQLLFQSTKDALLLLGPDFEVLLHNQAAEIYVVHSGDDAFRLRSSLTIHVDGLVSRATSNVATEEVEVEWEGQTLALALSPIVGDSAATAAVTIRDITAAKAQERELIVSDRMASLGMLSATIAHEVENANHVLSLNLETLRVILRRQPEQRGGLVEEPYRPKIESALESIAEASGRISGVLQDVRSYAVDGRKDKPVDMSPDEIAARVVRFTHLLVSRRAGTVELEIEGELPTITAIPGRLEQALINLVKNSSEALGDVSGKIALRVSRLNDREVAFAVCDQGRGMPVDAYLDPESVTARPFSTTRQAQGGSGLGLSIVRSIVEQHHGRLRFYRNDSWATIAEIAVPISKAGP